MILGVTRISSNSGIAKVIDYNYCE